ncbi:MAG: hypothetical protein J6S92_06490 [Oscillospiraceae bacterium]|nr:hypothetical protein [Oscillospiraceae bacterium]
MSTRDMALSLVQQLSENDLQMFLSLFGRLYPKSTAEKQQENAESLQAFHELENLIDRIPAFSVDEDVARDEYFKEKYGI